MIGRFERRYQKKKIKLKKSHDCHVYKNAVRVTIYSADIVHKVFQSVAINVMKIKDENLKTTFKKQKTKINGMPEFYYEKKK